MYLSFKNESSKRHGTPKPKATNDQILNLPPHALADLLVYLTGIKGNYTLISFGITLTCTNSNFKYVFIFVEQLTQKLEVCFPEKLKFPE